MEEILEEEEEDRISSIPDCLLVEILSRLPRTKYAIRTGVLSKRWQHLWTFVHTLIFNIEYFIRKTIYPSNILTLFNKTLTQCQSKKLNKLELHTRSSVGFDSPLNNFLHYAISCNVEKLYLISYDNFELKDGTFFNILCCTNLNIGGCKFSPSTGVISWNKLKSLHVSHSKLEEAMLQNILSGSPLLETLNLEDCYGYKRLDITSKSVKNLVFDRYNWTYKSGPVALEINAPNILSLTIQNYLHLKKLLLLNVSSLLKAYLNYTCGLKYSDKEEEMLEGLMLKLCHVKELKIGIPCSEALSRLKAKDRLPSGLKYIDVSEHNN